jgi:hypothetical protein
MARGKPSVEGLTFSRGFVARRDLILILSEDDKVASKKEHTKILQYKQGTWSHFVTAWGSVAICAMTLPSFELDVIGADGEVLRGTKEGSVEEIIDNSELGPQATGALRDARVVDKTIFAVGMARQAYRRERPGTWTRIDDGLRAKRDVIAGLNSVDGFHDDDVYAVGLGGEIWRWNGRRWSKLDSPTNLALNRVRCIPPKTVYACGMRGVVLRGVESRFEVIEQDNTKANFYGLEFFKGTLFVASLEELYTVQGNEFSLLDTGLGSGFTTGDLHANDGVLWSFGAKHLAFTNGSNKWSQVYCV